MTKQIERMAADYKGPVCLDEPAHVIETDEEAIAVAKALAPRFAADAAKRDRERLLPLAELDEFSESGLRGLTVPKAYGGADDSFATLSQVFAIISAADGSLGQIPQNHYSVVEIIHSTANDTQEEYFYAELLAGLRSGNAFAERGINPPRHA